MCEDSGLLMALMLLPEPSLTSNPGREAGPPLNFLLGREGAAGSFTEPLPGTILLRSGFTFSFSAEEGEENDWFNRAEVQTEQVQKNVKHLSQ